MTQTLLLLKLIHIPKAELWKYTAIGGVQEFITQQAQPMSICCPYTPIINKCVDARITATKTHHSFNQLQWQQLLYFMAIVIITATASNSLTVGERPRSTSPASLPRCNDTSLQLLQPVFLYEQEVTQSNTKCIAK